MNNVSIYIYRTLVIYSVTETFKLIYSFNALYMLYECALCELQVVRRWCRRCCVAAAAAAALAGVAVVLLLLSCVGSSGGIINSQATSRR